MQRDHEPGQIVIVFRLPERCDSDNGAITTFCNRDIFTISKYGDATPKACEAAFVSDPVLLRLSFHGRSPPDFCSQDCPQLARLPAIRPVPHAPLVGCGRLPGPPDAFDLLELNGTDLRREPIEVRKATLANILRKSPPDVRPNEHMEHPEGAVVVQHACKMGLQGIVSKRLGSRALQVGPLAGLAQFKNPAAPAGKREAEEDRNRKR